MEYDARHKEALRLFLKDYFLLFFPNLVPRMNFKTAQFLDKELNALFDQESEVLTGIKKKQKEQATELQRITDALILIEIDFDEGKTEWILIYWEHQSEREVDFDQRMFRNFCDIYFKYGKLVFPIAMFTDSAKIWSKPISNTFELSLFDYSINKYEYQLLRLKDFSAEEFEEKSKINPLAAAYLPLTNYGQEKRPLIKVKALKGVTDLVPEAPKQAVLFSLIEKNMRLNQAEQKEFQKLLRENTQFQEVKMLQSIKDVGIEIGIEQGREKEGINLISKQLKLKFQEHFSPYQKLVGELSLEQVETISERILTCDKIEIIFQGITPLKGVISDKS